MRRLRVTWLVGAALAAAAMVSSLAAQAAEETKEEKKEEKAEEKREKSEERAEARAEAREEKAEEKIFRLGLDMVFGSGYATTVNNVVPPGSTGGLLGTTTRTSGRVTSYSFLLEGDARLTDSFGIGARLPFVGGTLFMDPTRSDGGIGSLELFAAGRFKLSDRVHLELSLGLSLPTAQGSQIPPPPADIPVVQGAVDQSNYDRFAVLRAASQARGYEVDELFQPNHFGINPKIRLIAGREGKWHVEPWVKLDNLIATNTSYSFIDELVLGVNVGGFLIPEVEPVLRLWVNAPLTGADFTSAVAVVEPQIRFHFGPVTPYVGGILPFAGNPLTRPYDFGVRVGVSVRF